MPFVEKPNLHCLCPWRSLAVCLAALLVGGFALALGPATTEATVFGNPVNELAQDDVSAGLRLSNRRVGALVDYGLPGQGALRLLTGTVAIDGEYGPELGLGYRQKLGRFPLAAYRVRMGALALYREGVVESGDVDAATTQLDLGFGGRVTITEAVRGFALGIFNQTATRRVREDRDDRLSYQSQLGAAVGAELLPSQKLAVAGEVHLGLGGDSFGLYFISVF